MVGDRLGRAQIGPGEERARRLVDPAAEKVVEGGAERHGEMQHDGGIAIAVGGAGGAAVADEGGALEVPDRAHLLVPRLAAIEIELPVEEEVLVAAEAGEGLVLAAGV